ncbi:ABC transporter permease [Flavobacterium soyangense]|uniref:ABC transporter permease n=1 Tax=Flavobacterium soyangense TaxID=2023265 RepID=A0A930XW24_9FLAO|nr:ABC transporter permease [Flavobacterium soyangense]MBF2708931.1 ABC transporter permease [Flavobacterium soyangense]
MKKANKYFLLTPLLLWLFLFLVLPYCFILTQSVLTTDDFGKVIYHFNLDSYIKIFTNPLYYETLTRTFIYAIIVALVCILLSLPLAYFIAFKVQKHKSFYYTLIVLPFWMSYIVRAYAWKIILGEQGIFNSSLMNLGIIDKPLRFVLYSDFSVILCLIYIFLPFVCIPIYTSFEQISKSLVEASKDLGANSWKTFWKVIFPLILPGVISGGTLALVLTLGDFLAASLLGGPNTLFISNIVQNLFGTSNDKPLGSAVGVVLLVLVFLLLEFSSRYEKKHETQ